MKLFNNKVVFITGVSSGIGKRAAECFLEQGAIVVGTIRKDWESFTEKASEYPGRCFTEKLDVTDNTRINDVVKKVEAQFGQIDILINNAGVHMNATVLETTEEQWDDMFATNVKSVFLTSRAVLPGMLKRGSGVIINVASRVGMTGSPNSAAYCASKAAVVNLTREMALDFSRPLVRYQETVGKGQRRSSQKGNRIQPVQFPFRSGLVLPENRKQFQAQFIQQHTYPEPIRRHQIQWIAEQYQGTECVLDIQLQTLLLSGSL